MGRLEEGLDLSHLSQPPGLLNKGIIVLWKLCDSNDTQADNLLLTTHPAKRFLTE